MPIFDLFPLQPRRGDISVERSEPPISKPRRGDIYNFDKIVTHPTTKKSVFTENTSFQCWEASGHLL